MNSEAFRFLITPPLFSILWGVAYCVYRCIVKANISDKEIFHRYTLPSPDTIVPRVFQGSHISDKELWEKRYDDLRFKASYILTQESYGRYGRRQPLLGSALFFIVYLYFYRDVLYSDSLSVSNTERIISIITTFTIPVISCYLSSRIIKRVSCKLPQEYENILQHYKSMEIDDFRNEKKLESLYVHFNTFLSNAFDGVYNVRRYYFAYNIIQAILVLVFGVIIL